MARLEWIPATSSEIIISTDVVTVQSIDVAVAQLQKNLQQ